jgi:hypothetical protein
LRLWRAIEAEREINFHGSYIYRIVVSVTINAIHRTKARPEEQLRLAEDNEDEDAAEVKTTTLTDSAENSPEAQAEREEMLRKGGSGHGLAAGKPATGCWTCTSPILRLACIFNNFIKLLAARSDDAVRRLQRSQLRLLNPAAASLSA